MRIAMVNNFFLPRPSGSVHMTEGLAKGLAARGHDVLVAAVLLVLLVMTILTHAPISIEVEDSSLDRQSYVAFAIDVVVTLGLSWLLFSSRPRADNDGTRS